MHRSCALLSAWLGASIVWLAAGVSVVPAPVCAATRPHVYLVVVDGMGADRLDAMEQLGALRASGACPVTYPRARAVFPTRTNPNHVSLATGVYPGAHGITGNRYWDRASSSDASGLDGAEQIEVETLFTIAAKERPQLQTVGVFGKSKLGRLFGKAEGRQDPPDRVWAPGMATLGPVRLPQGANRGADHQVMDSAFALLEPEPDFLFASLSELDLTSHAHGASSDAALRALKAADAQVARLIGHLQDQGRLERSVVFITGDHGFSDVEERADGERYLIFGAVLRNAGVQGIHLVSDGGIEHVYVTDHGENEALDAGAVERLEAVRRAAVKTDGVMDALYRREVPGKPEAPTVAGKYPSWHVDHPRMGDMILVARPHIMFSDPPRPDELRMPGNHGGVAEEFVPLVICGGADYLRPQEALGSAQPSSPDVGVTIGALLGLRPTRSIGGAPIADKDRGRLLDAVRVP